jgi:hypothetical protein
MKAFVHTEFRTLRPGDSKNSTIEAGEVVEGGLAKAAIDNGFGEEVAEDAPVGRELVERRPPAQPVRAGKGKRKSEGEGES